MVGAKVSVRVLSGYTASNALTALQVSGTYFPANVYVSLYFDVVDDMHKLGTVKASSTGTFAFSFDVMEGYTGTHAVIAKYNGGEECTASFNVLNTRPMDERLVNFLNSIYVNLTTQIDNYFNLTSGTFYTFVDDWFTWIYGNLTVMNNTLNQVNATVNYINGTVNTINGTVNTINTTVNTINTTVTDVQNTTNFVWQWVQQIENKLDANGIDTAGTFNTTVINWFNWIYGNLSSVGDTVDQINTTVNYINGTVNAMNTTVNAMNATVNHIDGVVVFMNGTVGYINGTVNIINNTVNVINGTVNTISTTVNQINGTVNAMNTTVNYINGNVTAISTTVNQINATVNEIELKLDNNYINVAGNFFTWLFGNMTVMNTTINAINANITQMNDTINIINNTIAGLTPVSGYGSGHAVASNTTTLIPILSSPGEPFIFEITIRYYITNTTSIQRFAGIYFNVGNSTGVYGTDYTYAHITDGDANGETYRVVTDEVYVEIYAGEYQAVNAFYTYAYTYIK